LTSALKFNQTRRIVVRMSVRGRGCVHRCMHTMHACGWPSARFSLTDHSACSKNADMLMLRVRVLAHSRHARANACTCYRACQYLFLPLALHALSRAHVHRYEGMALSRVDSSTATIGGVAPVPLYEYNCTNTNSSGIGNLRSRPRGIARSDVGPKEPTVDQTIGPKGWTPSHGDGPCTLADGADAKPAMFVLPKRAGSVSPPRLAR
jgi:hypothetical protein